MSPSDIIEKIGVTFLASALGHKNVSTVSSWKSRGSIPVQYWGDVIAAAQARDVRGITLRVLAQACGAKIAEAERVS
ncbi:carph-isopro domain-containing protein [Lichenifustis flavocetrariae]|uniref:carph-isopro domain-containing protein n=1 Tax=Lichenifustis flavocetrariae TaxID=2949735 RepID=UPI003D0B7999